MTKRACIQDIRFGFECNLSGNEETDQRVLRLARLLPGFRQDDDTPGVEIQMPLAEAGNLRDILLDLWDLANNLPGSHLSIDDQRLPDTASLKQVLTILDCATAHDLASDASSYCHPTSGYDWGCQHLHDIKPITESDGSIDQNMLKQKINNVASNRFIVLCQHYAEPNLNVYLERALNRDAEKSLAWLKNKEIRIDQTVQQIITQKEHDHDAQRTIPVTSYAEIGGLDAVVQTLRETVELQLKHPEIFIHLGIKPHRGVLLYGPPGCGKTLLARAVAHESVAHFFAISGPELFTKWHGESEDNLRKLFAAAHDNQPAVVFFDEIDAIAQSRSSDENLRLDSRFTTQLLTLLDGVHDLGRIVVLATTNRLDLLDPALLRPGRFDCIIEIPPPDRAGRLKILQIHTRQLPLAEDVSLEAIADALDQTTGADIAYVVREAAYSGLRRGIDLDAVLSDNDQLQENVLSKIIVCGFDFDFGLICLERRNAAKITATTV
jgi:ATP-dependent 26S proteasome regulatory subunit